MTTLIEKNGTLYDFNEFIELIKTDGETPENLALLGEWFERNGVMFWNGECWDTSKELNGRNLYPITEKDVDYPDQYVTVGYELR